MVWREPNDVSPQTGSSTIQDGGAKDGRYVRATMSPPSLGPSAPHVIGLRTNATLPRGSGGLRECGRCHVACFCESAKINKTVIYFIAKRFRIGKNRYADNHLFSVEKEMIHVAATSGFAKSWRNVSRR